MTSRHANNGTRKVAGQHESNRTNGSLSDRRVGVTLVTVGAVSPTGDAALSHLAESIRAAHQGFSTLRTALADESGVSQVIASAQNTSGDSGAPSTQPFVICHFDGTASTKDMITDADLHGDLPTNSAQLTNQFTAAAQYAGLPVIVLTVAQPGITPLHPQPFKAGRANTSALRAITVREPYRDHDCALLIRQIFSMVEINLPETSLYDAYPVPPITLTGAEALDANQLQQAMTRLMPDWTWHQSTSDAEQSAELIRELRFRSFQAAIQFMHLVAPACDVANHHPRWENNWRRLCICLTTWDAKQQITERDIQLARYFDHVYTTFGYEVN